MRRPKKNSDGITAEEWLRKYLASGERRAIDAIEDAEASEFPIATINRAKARIGASSAKKDGEWYWYLTISAPKPAEPKKKTDEYGYSIERPQVAATVNWLDVIKRINQLRKSGLDHLSIINQIMEMAYPHAGISESMIMTALRANDINVPNKVLDIASQL